MFVPEKKFIEIKSWFLDHFKNTNQREYIRRSPFVVFWGPTGCGKTTTLQRIGNELDLSIKEFSETTDTSLIQFELRGGPVSNLDKRRSLILESFVISNLRYETLYADEPRDHDDAADEFDEDDDFIPPIRIEEIVKRKKRTPKGLIIHIESPLTFGRSTPVLIQCLRKLRKTINEISRQTPRRVAIVFEAVDGNDYIMSLSSCVKQSLDITILKINPVTRANMKKFIEMELGRYNYRLPDKDTLEQLIDDCDGDVSACKNTLSLLCDQSPLWQCHHLSNPGGGIAIPASKRQKVEGKKLSIHPKLMRDISKGSGFFHILGKIFYQRRFYPLPNPYSSRVIRSIDRPYEAENTTEHLVNQVDSESTKLNAWLHQNYTKYCEANDIEKAALFMENLSFVDTLSLDSTQSTQYYESHKSIDLTQKHVAIESTVFSLYKDESKTTKKSNDKKVINKKGQTLILRSSVASNWMMKTDNIVHGFSKPTSLMISKLSEDHQNLLDRLSLKMTRLYDRPYEQSNLLLDYAPYMKILSDKGAFRPDPSQGNLRAVIEEVQRIEEPSDVDYDQKHETLLDLIDQCDSQKVIQQPGEPMYD